MKRNTQVENITGENLVEYAIEYPDVLEKEISHSGTIHREISEAAIRDLTFVDVRNRRYTKVKRCADFIVSALGLLVLIIPLFMIGALIYIDDPGKVFFSQYRVGLNGKRFKLYKLRTMRANTPKYLSTQKVDNPDEYITRLGHILRKSSIDELPQLINVLRGDMSLVGPRPLISDEYEIHELRRRFGVYNVRPGITGLAQIKGRDTVSPADKVHWDVKYLQEYGLKTDVKIILATIPKLLSGNGVVEGHPSKN